MIDFLGEEMSWADMADKIFSNQVEPTLIEPTFIFDYPVEMSPFAKIHRDDPRLVERFEAFVGGQEIANAFSELNDPREQKKRFLGQEKSAEAQPYDEDFILALEHGMPPTGGLGLGIDRLVMLLTNKKNLREVILFPAMKNL
jgi:lysyl-tRNA synthetase class 2